MKQPELGTKIAELRKSKGLTQEELVDKCNITVRTLQRIEAGEVTPRAYTIKSILAVLEYEFSKIINDQEDTSNRFALWFKKLMFIDSVPQSSSADATKQLNLALIFGIIYFIQFFFHGALEQMRFFEEGMFFTEKEPPKYFHYMKDIFEFNTSLYIFTKLIGLISFVYFQRGFILIGEFFNNYLLRIVSILLIFVTFLFNFYDIVSLFYDSIERPFILGGTAFAWGILVIFYGISLKRLRKTFGTIARYAGILNIISGCFFLTIVLSFFNLALFIPIQIIEIIILYKAIEMIKAEND